MNILKTFRLDETLVDKLAERAQGTRRTEKFHVEEALRHYFVEYEDARLAKDRFNDPKGKIISSQKMRKRFGV
jgi:predicted transcriptional regulator